MAKSSKQWLRRHVTDPYVRKAKEQGYRSRAAFKLLELSEKEKILKAGLVVVDLGAAPGGWSQVAAAKVQPGGRVIAIDILEIAPIPGVTVLKADFREEKSLIDALAGAKADVVLSDLAPNISGIPLVDQSRQLELGLAAVEFCRKALKQDGVFVVKAFHGGAFSEFVNPLKAAVFQKGGIKPTASRGESSETYVVARSLLSPGKSA